MLPVICLAPLQLKSKVWPDRYRSNGFSTTKTNRITWHHIPKSDSGHSHKTKVKSIEKRPAFPQSENDATDAKKTRQKGQS